MTRFICRCKGLILSLWKHYDTYYHYLLLIYFIVWDNTLTIKSYTLNLWVYHEKPSIYNTLMTSAWRWGWSIAIRGLKWLMSSVVCKTSIFCVRKLSYVLRPTHLPLRQMPPCFEGSFGVVTGLSSPIIMMCLGTSMCVTECVLLWLFKLCTDIYVCASWDESSCDWGQGFSPFIEDGHYIFFSLYIWLDAGHGFISSMPPGLDDACCHDPWTNSPGRGFNHDRGGSLKSGN